MSWCDSNGGISYVTAHMQTIRAQPCFKGAASPRAPLGSSQGKPSTVQTDLCILDNAASALWAQTSELSSLLWKCLCKRPDPPGVCVSSRALIFNTCALETGVEKQICEWKESKKERKGRNGAGLRECMCACQNAEIRGSEVKWMKMWGRWWM